MSRAIMGFHRALTSGYWGSPVKPIQGAGSSRGQSRDCSHPARRRRMAVYSSGICRSTLAPNRMPFHRNQDVFVLISAANEQEGRPNYPVLPQIGSRRSGAAQASGHSICSRYRHHLEDRAWERRPGARFTAVRLSCRRLRRGSRRGRGERPDRPCRLWNAPLAGTTRGLHCAIQ